MTLGEVRQSLIDYLTGQGIHAIGAWSGSNRLSHSKAVAAVSLKALQLAPLGQQNYLGTRFDQDTAATVQVYGRKLSLTFGLDLYAPKGEPELCLSLFDQLGQVLCSGGPDGLVIGGLRCGQLSYDPESSMLTCTAELDCQAWCYAVQKEDGMLVTDIIVKGEPKL